MSALLDVGDMSAAEVLMRLYNAAGAPAHAEAMAWIEYKLGDAMTVEQAQALLATAPAGARLYVDYLHGRIIKTNVAERPIDPRLYDRDHGQGAAARALGVKP